MYNEIRDRCPKCTQAAFQSPEHQSTSWRRSPDKSSAVLKTANGRSIEFDSLGANAYPLVQDTYEIPRVQSQASSNEFNPGSRETHASQEVERKVKVPNAQSDPSSLSKLLLTLPSYIPRSSSALLRRLGLGSQRYVM